MWKKTLIYQSFSLSAAVLHFLADSPFNSAKIGIISEPCKFIMVHTLKTDWICWRIYRQTVTTIETNVSVKRRMKMWRYVYVMTVRHCIIVRSSNLWKTYHLTPRLILSCALLNTRKSCFLGRKIRFWATLSVFRRVILSVLKREIVKVGRRNSQSEAAKLTWWQAKIDYSGGAWHVFWKYDMMKKYSKDVYHIEYQLYIWQA